MSSTWLEVCLVVDGEMAKAASEVLSRYALNGVVIESTQIKPDLQGEGKPGGPWRICAYLPVDADLEHKRHSLEEALWHLGVIRPLPEPQYQFIQETDWSEAWKQHFQPVNIGRRLAIVPAWMQPPDPSKVMVQIDPGMAFGTGTHPSTQLCLEMIADWMDRSPNKATEEASLNSAHPTPKTSKELTMIDVGCGSGILAIAALKLGVSRALGIDVDPQAIAVARTNSQLNGISDRLELQVSSLPEILLGHFSLKQADLVAANILAPVLVRMLAEGLGQLLTQHSRLVLAGILEEQISEVLSSADEQGLQLVDKRQMGDWVAIGLEQS